MFVNYSYVAYFTWIVVSALLFPTLVLHPTMLVLTPEAIRTVRIDEYTLHYSL